MFVYFIFLLKLIAAEALRSFQFGIWYWQFSQLFFYCINIFHNFFAIKTEQTKILLGVILMKIIMKIETKKNKMSTTHKARQNFKKQNKKTIENIQKRSKKVKIIAIKKQSNQDRIKRNKFFGKFIFYWFFIFFFLLFCLMLCLLCAMVIFNSQSLNLFEFSKYQQKSSTVKIKMILQFDSCCCFWCWGFVMACLIIDCWLGNKKKSNINEKSLLLLTLTMQNQRKK